MRLSWDEPYLKECSLELKDWTLTEEKRGESCLRDGKKDGFQALEWWEPCGKGLHEACMEAEPRISERPLGQ